MARRRKNISSRITLFIVIAIFAIGLFIVLKHKKDPVPESQSLPAHTPSPGSLSDERKQSEPKTVATNESPQATPTPPDKTITGHFSTEGDIEGIDTQVFRVSLDAQGFAPETTNIKVGDIVVFQNDSKKDMWPQVVDTKIYPEFDAMQAVAPGEKFSFKFIKPGTWKFQDKLNPEFSGVIHVE